MLQESKQSKGAFSSHLTRASELPGKTWKHKNHIISITCCSAALPDFN